MMGAPRIAIIAAMDNRALRALLATRSPRCPPSRPPNTPPMRYTIPQVTPARATEYPCTRVMKAGRNVAKAYILKFNNAPDKMIHHKVRMRSTAYMDPLPSIPEACSDSPRPGSCTRSNNGTKMIAGAAALTNAVRQPQACAIGPHNKKLNAPPIGTPSMNTDKTRARRCGGNRSPIQLVPTGAQTASPTPTPSRVNTRNEKLMARPDAAVSADHTVTPMVSSFLRLQTSATRPSGTPARAYTQMNMLPRSPIWVSDKPNSFRIGSTSAPGACRS